MVTAHDTTATERLRRDVIPLMAYLQFDRKDMHPRQKPLMRSRSASHKLRRASLTMNIPDHVRVMLEMLMTHISSGRSKRLLSS